MSANRQYCTFRLQDHLFGIEVQAIQEVIRFQEMTQVPLAPESIRGLINLRGQMVTAIDLRSRLGLPAAGAEEPPMNVIVRTPDGAVSLLVDEIGDVVDVDGDLHEEPPPTLRGSARELVEGVYKLPQSLLLILNVAGTVNIVPCLPENPT